MKNVNFCSKNDLIMATNHQHEHARAEVDVDAAQDPVGMMSSIGGAA
jgi:hypothetical protein